MKTKQIRSSVLIVALLIVGILIVGKPFLAEAGQRGQENAALKKANSWHEVTGTGFYLTDINAVQDAVDNYDKVKLIGTFNFGEMEVDFFMPDPADPKTWPISGWGYPFYASLDKSGVFITKNVEITGGTDDVFTNSYVHGEGRDLNTNNNNATINGGRVPLVIFAPGQDVKISRLNLHPVLLGINPLSCGDLIIDNVKINEVIPDYGKLGSVFGGSPIHKFGIWCQVASFFDPGNSSTYQSPCFIQFLDNITVSNCNIDLGNDGAWGDFTACMNFRGIGTEYDPSKGTEKRPVNIVVKDNVVSNSGFFSIIYGETVGTTTIKNNFISPKRAGIVMFHEPSNNYVLPDGTYEGRYYRAEWQKGTVSRNTIVHSSWNGIYGNGLRRNSSIKNNIIKDISFGQTCIMLHSFGVTNNDGATIRHNVCSGSGMSSSISLISATNCTVMKNDCSEANPWFAQIRILPGQDNNSVINNDLGPVVSNSSEGGLGGIFCEGSGNNIVNNTFHGDYPGWPDSGFVLLGYGSQDNIVVACKKGNPPHEFDICVQIADMNRLYPPYITRNTIQGYSHCSNLEADVVAAIEDRKAAAEAEIANLEEEAL